MGCGFGVSFVCRCESERVVPLLVLREWYLRGRVEDRTCAGACLTHNLFERVCTLCQQDALGCCLWLCALTGP